VDLSESGISAILRLEVPMGEVIRLEFTPLLGDVEILAVVRQRNAFRYGFQFVETSSAQDIIGRTCRQLSVERSVSESRPSTNPLRAEPSPLRYKQSARAFRYHRNFSCSNALR
jgi:hypothetical protein